MEILIGIGLLLIVSGVLGMAINPEQEANKVMTNPFGDVNWNHELHARMKEIKNCNVCHHNEKQGEMNPRPCGDCHHQLAGSDSILTPELFMTVSKKVYQDENGPSAMKALHGSCMGCHKAMKKGPVICRDCHAQNFSGTHGNVQWNHTAHSRNDIMVNHQGFAGQCTDCHHQDTEAKTDADFRACSTCHKPIIEKDLSTETGIRGHEEVTHLQCQSCHVQFNPEEDNRSCISCHEGFIVDHSETPPSLEQAVHEKCENCHHQDNAELTQAMPTNCVDCHKPDPSRVEYPEMRSLLWDHKKHGQYTDVNCTTCHHQDSESGPKLACSSCHGKDHFDNPSLETALKKVCLDCHKERKVGLTTWENISFEKTPPHLMTYEGEKGKFAWNHQFHAIDTSISCQNCHHNIVRHDNAYVTATRIEQEWPEEARDIQSCRNCHGDSGAVKGSVAENTNAPDINRTYEKICVTCHQNLGAGPQQWDDFF